MIAFVGSLTWIVTARSAREANSNSTGSETMGAPVGIVTEFRPPKVKRLAPFELDG